MKSETELWGKVQKDYPHLGSDDEIADEVLATYSGNHGKQRLQVECQDFKNGNTIFRRIGAALDRFWKNVSNFFSIEYKSVEEVADRVFYDLLNEVNPLVYTKQGVQKLSDRMILGQKKSEKTELADVNTRLGKVLDHHRCITTRQDLPESDIRTAEYAAKQAVHDRIVMSSARRFTPEQIDILNHYRAMFTADTSTCELFSRLYEDVVKDPDVARKPEKWKTDTLRELNGLAEGITRDERQELKL